MTPERYHRAKTIFQAALDLEPDARGAYVARASAGDEDLERDVLSLMAHDDQSSGFLETPVVGEPPPAVSGHDTRAAGSLVGPYEIVEPIGAGSMGEVYRARDSRFGREVAIKFLPAEFTRDADRVARFEREARAAGPLNHPNILTVHDCGRADGVPYLVSELLQGETLRKQLERSAMPAATAVTYAAQVARGLGVAHGRGIVHRDLKPENIFVTSGGVVKILDFGLAKLPGVPAASAGGPAIGATQAGIVMGTFGYMSPEQVRAEPADHRSDIFSLGVVLHEMLAGTRPFTRDTWADEASAILRHEAPEVPGDRLRGVGNGAALRRILQRCLAKQPDDRFQSARDLAFALESLLEQDAQAPAQPVVRSRGRVAPWASAAVALVAAVAAGAFYVASLPQSPSPEFQRITFRRGVVSAARFTADGNTVVYSAGWDGDEFRLYSMRTESTESHTLGDSSGMLFAVSSQGHLAICRPTGRTQHGLIGTLARVPLSGGGAKNEAEDVSAADWFPDGSLAVVRVENERSQIESPVGHVLYRPSTGGGYLESLRVSPKGDAVAFLDHPLLDDSAGAVAMVDVASGEYRVLSNRFNSMRGLAWSPDGREVWFAAATHGTNLAVWAVDRNRSRRERLVAQFPAYVSLEDIARDGRALLSFHTLSNSLVHVSAAGERKDLYWHDQSQVRDFSRDGRSILISESGDATREDYEAYVRSVDGASPAVRLGVGLPLSVSSDGRWVVANPAGAPAPLTLLPTGRGESRTLAADGINHLGAAWLPGDQEVVFAGAAVGEGVRYYVQPLHGGGPRPITAADIIFERRSPIVVSPDSRFVAAVSRDRRIVIYPTDGGLPRVVPGLEPGFTPLQWCSDDRLAVHRYDALPPQVLKVDVRTGEVTPWRELSIPNPVGLVDLSPIRVSPDCQSYAFSPLNVLSEVYITKNLKK